MVEFRPAASMRPRHKAAENAVEDVEGLPELRASMRPRHKAAENDVGQLGLHRRHAASMRPRHKAAENLRRFSEYLNVDAVELQ